MYCTRLQLGFSLDRPRLRASVDNGPSSRKRNGFFPAMKRFFSSKFGSVSTMLTWTIKLLHLFESTDIFNVFLRGPFFSFFNKPFYFVISVVETPLSNTRDWKKRLVRWKYFTLFLLYTSTIFFTLQRLEVDLNFPIWLEQGTLTSDFKNYLSKVLL